MVWVLAAFGAALLAAASYDWVQRRRGVSVRAGRDITSETLHNHIDLEALPYEPARHAGQRDWATYRRRDKRRRK
jgi:hypothetical protein